MIRDRTLGDDPTVLAANSAAKSSTWTRRKILITAGITVASLLVIGAAIAMGILLPDVVNQSKSNANVNNGGDNGNNNGNNNGGNNNNNNPTVPPTTPAPTGYVTPVLSYPPTSGRFAMFINCGASSAYTDKNNRTWQADAKYVSGNVYTSYTYTNANAIYNSERNFNMKSKNEGYQISAPNGKYYVRLHFAEIYFPIAEQRKFKVFVEGTNPYTANNGVIDLIAITGDRAVPFLLDTTVEVTDGALNINFEKVLQNPKVSAIEILSVAA